jgi:hypothetical protein
MICFGECIFLKLKGRETPIATRNDFNTTHNNTELTESFPTSLSCGMSMCKFKFFDFEVSFDCLKLFFGSAWLKLHAINP